MYASVRFAQVQALSIKLLRPFSVIQIALMDNHHEQRGSAMRKVEMSPLMSRHKLALKAAASGPA
jgi:hypothetical protein